MEYLNTFKIKNAKLYKLLQDKKEIVVKGRKINEELEPLMKKVKPLQEELSQLENKLRNKEEKIMLAVADNAKKLKSKLGEWEELTMFNNSEEKDIVEFNTIDVLKRKEEELEKFKEEFKKQKEEQKGSKNN